MSGKLLTSAEVAEKLQMSPEAVCRAVKAGHLPALRVGPRGRLRFCRSDVERALQHARGESAQAAS